MNPSRKTPRRLPLTPSEIEAHMGAAHAERARVLRAIIAAVAALVKGPAQRPGLRRA